jgi:Protein of unknown function (DUF2971)
VSKEFLYKYRSFDGATRLHAERLLVHNEAYFASPATFNDPFDCRVRFSMDGTDEQHRANLERLFLKCAPTWSGMDRRNKMDQIVAEGRHRDPQVYQGVTKVIQADVDGLGVYCLSKVPDHILMWAHYSKGHAGFCAQFRHENEPLLGGAQPVSYSDTYLAVALLDDPGDAVTKTLLTKAKFWGYEREWRVFDLNGGPGVRQFPPELLTGVIFGCRMPHNDRQQIRAWAFERRPRPKLYEARPKPNEFGLEILRIA